MTDLTETSTVLLGALTATAFGLASAVYSEWRTGAQKPQCAREPAVDLRESATTAVAGIRRVPLTIFHATTTGTAKRYAQQLQKELFAANIAGFHFDVSLVDLGEYNAEELEDVRLAVILMPTWTNGVPPEPAAPFLSYLRDLSTDFRVAKGHYGQLQYAVFGLGNSEYDENWCRAAIDVDAALHSLSASPLLPVCKGDDNSDQDGTFSAWTSSLVPALCEIYAQECGEEDEKGMPAPGAAGCGTCGTSSSLRQRTPEEQGARGGGCGNAGCACATEAGREGQDGGKEWLPQNEYRRQKRKAAEEKERRKAREARAAALSASLSASAAGSVLDGPMDYTEEDEINDRILAESEIMHTLSAAIAEFVDSDEEEDAGDGTVNGGVAPAVRSGAAAMVGEGGEEGGLVDLEEIGNIMAAASEERKKEESDWASGAGAREMVTPAQRKALMKEGYKIIGSHSAVKLCRWTKAQLRGRGGCYKHTLYGIQSYQCMEATPSLACANKCTFCWRHHKNPVGRSWRWKVDDPGMIVDTAIEKHVAMIKEFKGAPGVLPDRWAEAHTVRHCALSLVGEPIMYPHINELVRHLHAKRISSFLVTNAQFPEAISSLGPVTQLYVSVDASTKDVLKAIDRPLFTDFWERFIASLTALRSKGQRTVYRLTLVKGQNCGKPEDVASYADLIRVGEPDFIEVKGVTWCGVSDGSDLTMANVPWHQEVKAFTEQLAAAAGAGYALAAEHAHSCCVLLAKTKFCIDGAWHTHIDYERFHDLVGRYYASDGKETFTSLDYMSPTPNWALYDCAEAGFDPIETRWRRNKGGDGSTEIGYKASESGCG